jgi:hypothetical protein
MRHVAATVDDDGVPPGCRVGSVDPRSLAASGTTDLDGQVRTLEARNAEPSVASPPKTSRRFDRLDDRADRRGGKRDRASLRIERRAGIFNFPEATP